MYKYIAVAGNIGTGKSSLVKFISKEYKFKPLHEIEGKNPYLLDFYKNMSTYSFHSQISFLINKLKLYQKMYKIKEKIILDRTIYEDAEIFAKNLYKNNYMNKKDFNTYWILYQCIIKNIKKPNKLIYLQCSTSTLVKRIKLRNINNQQQIPTSYLDQLQKLYRNWIDNIKNFNIIKLNTDNFNYINNIKNKKKIKQILNKILINIK